MAIKARIIGVTPEKIVILCAQNLAMKLIRKLDAARKKDKSMKGYELVVVRNRDFNKVVKRVESMPDLKGFRGRRTVA